MPNKKKSASQALRHAWAVLSAHRWLLPVLCYLVTFAAVLAVSCVSLVIDSRDRASGYLAQRQLSVADFELVNATAEGNVVTSTNEDPQMIYTAQDIRLDSLTLVVGYNMHPYERCLYYSTDPAQPFGQDRRVWPVENADGSVTFSLPAGVRSIRLDAGSRTNLEMTFESIVLNAPRTAADYFMPDGGGWFALLALPGFAAAVLQWGMDMLRKRSKK